MQINFDDICKKNTNATQNTQTKNLVSYFSLKDNGDEAIVRIMHDSTADFDICDVHQIPINGRYQKVNCIRSANDPIENCPLCESGNKLQRRIFIHLIEYVRDDQGKIQAIPKVWDRPISYAYKLKNYIEEYGPLSDSVCKIKRKGAKNSKSTDYDIMYGLNKNVYRDDLYPKKPELFDGYKALGRAVWNRNYESMMALVPNKEERAELEEQPQYVAKTIPPTQPQSSQYTPLQDTAPTVPSQTSQPQQAVVYRGYQENQVEETQPQETYMRKPATANYQQQSSQPWANRPKRTYYE